MLNNKIIISWAMGLTQQEDTVDNIREIVILLLQKGRIGKKDQALVQFLDILIYKGIEQCEFGGKHRKFFR